MVAEEIVLAAARAVGAAHAADNEDGHAHRHQDGHEISIRREQMNQVMHIEGHHLATSETSLLCNQGAIFQSTRVLANTV